jgi:hypothetical protein
MLIELGVTGERHVNHLFGRQVRSVVNVCVDVVDPEPGAHEDLAQAWPYGMRTGSTPSALRLGRERLHICGDNRSRGMVGQAVPGSWGVRTSEIGS